MSMKNTVQITVRVSEAINKAIVNGHNDFCKDHSITATFNSYTAHLIELGLEAEKQAKGLKK